MIEQQREEERKLRLLSKFLGRTNLTLQEAMSDYWENYERKKLVHYAVIKKLNKLNHLKMLKHNVSSIEFLHDIISNLKKFENIQDNKESLNSHIFIYTINGQKYFTKNRLMVEKIIDDPFSTEEHKLISKINYDPLARRAEFNNQELYRYEKTTLGRMLIQRQMVFIDEFGDDIEESEYIENLLNYFRFLKLNSAIDVKFDLEAENEWGCLVCNPTKNITPESVVNMKGIDLISSSLFARNSYFLNECISADYLYLEKDFDIILKVAKMNIYYFEHSLTYDSNHYSEAIRTFYLLIKAIDENPSLNRIGFFDKIHYFYDMKSETKIYNKIFANKEVIKLYNKLEKSFYPHRFSLREQQEKRNKN